MFKHKHGHGHGCGGWSMSRGEGPGGRPGRFGGRGPFGGSRPGGPFSGRGPRMFDSGALRLVVLGLIAEEPRHGYDVIKALEAKFQGAYSPSPGAIYPMLQMLEESDLVVSEANGNKRLFSITEQGKAFIEENRAELDRINAQIDQASDRFGGVALGDELRALKHDLYGKLREGSLSPEQAKKALDILKKARKDLDEL